MTLKEARHLLEQECSITDCREQDELLRFFHRISSIVHFDQEGLRDLVIIRPQWLFDAMKALITQTPKYVGLAGEALPESLPEQAVLDPARWDLLWRHVVSPVDEELPGKLEV